MRRLLSLSISVLFVFSSCKTEEIKTTNLTQEQEAELLQKQYANIVSLSESEGCKDSNDWLFTAIGNKACGGPTEFIAYSKNINTVSFLNLVEDYTLAQKEYNQKWGVMSDCSVPPTPSDVKCENGLPVLIF